MSLGLSRRTRSLRFGLVGGAGLVTACASGALQRASAGHSNPPLSIKVRDSVTTFARRPTVAWVDVVATITNHGDRRLYGDDCYVEAQRKINANWVTVWNESCLVQHLTSIAPGDSLVRTIRIKGSFAPGDPLRADPRLAAGTYRLTFPLSYSTVNSPTGPALHDLPPEGMRSSPPFDIRDP
jgi:hypothetical protein